MHIVGTAGHVDHGKSALVRALTGTDPDRWIEERLRGMTLDLGFAHLRFPDGVEAGIIDVPGHERFLHNMLAGAAGMELLLLVVAANEGPKPQTAEHLAILQYLSVRRTIIVLTKCDTVDEHEQAFAEELVREAVAATIAQDAPLVRVSSVTGEGLERLRSLIHGALGELPPRAPAAPPYLPIDRVFALAGHGTIVTGTLMQGRIAPGDTLALSPLGRDVRVRNLQVFGAKRDSADGGSRVAVNLPGIETSEIARGAVLASPQFEARANFVVHFRPYPAALSLLRRRTPVRAYVGSAELLGTLVFETLPLKAQVEARLFLRAPTVVFPEAAFVVRRLSPKTLLGGGTIAVAGPTAPSDGDCSSDRDAPEVAAVWEALRAAGLAGGAAAVLGAAANVREEVAEATLSRLADDGRALRLQKPAAYAAADVINPIVLRIVATLRASERATPWLFGVSAMGLSRALSIPEPTLLRILAVAALDGRLAARDGYYASPDFVPTLTVEQEIFFDRAFLNDAPTPVAFAARTPQERSASVGGPAEEPVAIAALVADIKAANVPGLAQAFDTLLAGGALVRIGDALYRGPQIADIRKRLEAALRRDKQITMAGFRDLIGTSRKYAVPLLEWFDATGVTIRAGDYRLLRIKPPPRPK